MELTIVLASLNQSLRKVLHIYSHSTTSITQIEVICFALIPCWRRHRRQANYKFWSPIANTTDRQCSQAPLWVHVS